MLLCRSDITFLVLISTIPTPSIIIVVNVSWKAWAEQTEEKETNGTKHIRYEKMTCVINFLTIENIKSINSSTESGCFLCGRRSVLPPHESK